MQPQRIQLSHKKGFNLQEYSKSLNGLEAVKCDRTTKFGNPFRVEYDKDIKSYLILKENKDDKFSVLEILGIYDKKNKEKAIKKSIELFESLIKNNDEKNLILEFQHHSFTMINNYKYLTTELIRKELKGKNLACWCKEGESCHCNILLRIANE